MSRTDHHLPSWVQALHAHADGHVTDEIHGAFCRDRFDPHTGRTGPLRTHSIRLVDASAFDRDRDGHCLADELGWEYAERWNEVSAFCGPRLDRFGNRIAYARVPVPAHPCDIDTGGSRCRRFVAYIDRRRRYRYTNRAPRAAIMSAYFGPERRSVRDALRNAAREANAAAAGEEVDWMEWEPDAQRGRGVPVRQHRHAEWGGGWWD